MSTTQSHIAYRVIARTIELAQQRDDIAWSNPYSLVSRANGVARAGTYGSPGMMCLVVEAASEVVGDGLGGAPSHSDFTAIQDIETYLAEVVGQRDAWSISAALDLIAHRRAPGEDDRPVLRATYDACIAAGAPHAL